MDIKQLNSAIMFGTWSNTELTSMIDAVKFARASLQKQIKRSLTVGDTVTWTSTRNGRPVHGTVVKIAIKFVTVRELPPGPAVLWRVPANMLEAA